MMELQQIDRSSLVQKKNDVVYGVKSHEHMIVKDVDLSRRTVTGYYNTCFYFDSDYDVSLPGSNMKSITERGPASNAIAKIKHLKDHRWSDIPGKIEVLEERPFIFKGQSVPGVYFETKMSRSQLGIDTLINYQEGVYDNHSFGFQYLDIEMIDEESEKWNQYLQQLINPEDASKAGFMFLVKEYKMFEGSTVGLGANSLTPYLGVKSQNKEALILKVNERYELLQKQLKSGGQSDETMQSFQMELMQLQQLTKELFDHEPSIKDTLIAENEKRRQQNDTIVDLRDTIKEINFFNSKK
jgi:hypothetical protein